MRTIIAISVFASLVATSAVAKTDNGRTTHLDRSNIYQSDALGHQSYPNPDRDFSIKNLGSHTN